MAGKARWESTLTPRPQSGFPILSLFFLSLFTYFEREREV